MPMETYRLVIGETDSKGLTVDLYGGGGTITESTRAAYDDYGLTVAREEARPTERNHEFRADVMMTDLQLERQDGAFVVRVLGDGEELHSERIVDSDWGLTAEE